MFILAICLAGGPSAGTPGEKVALFTLMEREGFTDQELGLLNKSGELSNALVKSEEKATQVMKGSTAEQGRMPQSVRGSAGQVASSSEKLTNGAEQAAVSAGANEVSRKIAAETQQISAAAQRQLGAMSEMRNAGRELEKLAENLDRQIRHFNI